MKERLQKIMAMAGIGSRRANEDLIREGRVRVNGKVAKVGDQADLGTDVVEVDGVRLNTKAVQPRVYFAIFKPRNVLANTTERRDEERKTVRDFVPYKGHLFSIGRLDADSDGLVVLTNDGELAQRLSHPRFRHTKSYRVVVSGLPTAEALERWMTGIYLEEGRTAPCYVSVTRGGTKESVLKVVMTEGKKRQIRRVASIIGHPVIRLTRIAIGRLDLGDLKPGEWRSLEEEDVRKLSTPAPEFKSMRARRPSRTERRDPETPPLYGEGKDDDVRSRRQRQIARGERPEDDRPRRSAPRGERPNDERPRRPAVRGERPEDDRPRRPSARFERAERDESGGDRPRRPAVRGERPEDDRPRRPSARFERAERDESADDRPRRSAPRGERPNDERPRRPAVRGERSERSDRPSERPARRGPADDDRSRRSDGPPTRRTGRPAAGVRRRGPSDRPGSGPARRPGKGPTSRRGRGT